MEEKEQQKERFCSLLRATGRENIEYVIEDLTDLGFFEAPASVKGHGSYPGGLLAHSLNVYDAAMGVRENLLSRRPDLAPKLTHDSVTIAALLHDICKADLYVSVRRKKKNEIGAFEEQEVYEIHDERFPIGHGEKSAMLLLRSGLDITENELCAIRWHMGPWNLSHDDEKFYRQAGKISPLPPLIHVADTIASALYERDLASLKD